MAVSKLNRSVSEGDFRLGIPTPLLTLRVTLRVLKLFLV